MYHIIIYAILDVTARLSSCTALVKLHTTFMACTADSYDTSCLPTDFGRSPSGDIKLRWTFLPG